jgi:cytochrome-b5 reductase
MVGDMLLKQELDELQRANPDRLQIFHHLAKPSSSWTGWKGFQSAEMLKLAKIPVAKEADTMIFVCGSPDMMEAVSGNKAPDKSQGEIKPSSILGKLGYPKEQVFKF